MEFKGSTSCHRLSAFQPEIDLLNLNDELSTSPKFNTGQGNDSPNNSFMQPSFSQSCIDVNGNISHDCCELRRLSIARSSQSLKLGGGFQNNGHAQFVRGEGMTLSEKLGVVYSQAHNIILNNGQHSKRNGTTTIISNIFYQYEMHELHALTGEHEIEQVLKFLVKACPISKNTIFTATEVKRLHQLRSALFKECGFSIKAGVTPVMSFKHKTRLFPKAGGDLSKDRLSLLILLCVRNRQGNRVYLDCRGRVYKNLKDWEKNNTLPPSTLVLPAFNSNSKCSSQEVPFTLRSIPSPSSTPAKRALDVADVTIGVSALSAGVAACVVLSGGMVIPLAIPLILAGEIVSTIYMSVRATSSITNARKHQPKLRR